MFETYLKLASNPPIRNEETLFEVIGYFISSLPEHRRNYYPKFDIWKSQIGFAKTITDSETLIHLAITDAKKNNIYTYCFHIIEFPINRIASGGLGVSYRLYDHKGNYLDHTFCSELRSDHGTEYGRFRGRPVDTQRFKAGDIVKVLDNKQVCLAIVADSVVTPDWLWGRIEKMKSRYKFNSQEFTDVDLYSNYICDSTDDQLVVIAGPGKYSHKHMSPMFVMPLRFTLSNKLRMRYEKYLEQYK